MMHRGRGGGGRQGLRLPTHYYTFQSKVEQISDDIPCRIKFLSCCIVDMVAVSRKSAFALGKEEDSGLLLGRAAASIARALVSSQASQKQGHKWTLIRCRRGAGGAIRIKRSWSLAKRWNVSCCCRREMAEMVVAGYSREPVDQETRGGEEKRGTGSLMEEDQGSLQGGARGYMLRKAMS